MKKILIIILVLIAGLIIYKREPWVTTYSSQQTCEAAHSNERLSCQQWTCDNVQTTFWLDCPHGAKFWKPMYQYALNSSMPENQTQQSNETINWKIYTNSQYEFEVKYPSNWESVVNNNIGGDIVFAVGFKPANLQGETLANIYVSLKKLGFLKQINQELQQSNWIITLQNSGDTKFENTENQIFNSFKFLK